MEENEPKSIITVPKLVQDNCKLNLTLNDFLAKETEVSYESPAQKKHKERIEQSVSRKLKKIEDLALNKYFRDKDGIRKPDILKERTYTKVKGRKLHKELINNELDLKQSIVSAARAEILQPTNVSKGYLETENEFESTYDLTQEELKPMLDMNTRSKLLDLKFIENKQHLGPYKTAYTFNGRYLAFGSLAGNGHVGVMDCLRNTPKYEIFLNEKINDLKFLHCFKYLAIAQQESLFIYDETGAEIHRLRHHERPLKLEFLKYHFLLASVTERGNLVYQDTSTGELVSFLKTRRGKPTSFAQNFSTAILGIGHANGTVTLWSAKQKEPVVDIFCQRGGVNDLCFDVQGHYMYTTGRSNRLSVRDMRKSFQRVNVLHTNQPVNDLEVSNTGLLALNCGKVIKIWKDCDLPKSENRSQSERLYMRHDMFGHHVSDIKFRPFEDILSIGYEQGVKTCVVPGAGLANFDSYEANPFETPKQLREREVKNVLEKLRPEMITLQPSRVGMLSKKAAMELEEEEEEGIETSDSEAETKKSEKRKKKKHKMKGKGKIGRKMAAKQIEQGRKEREKFRKKQDTESSDKLSKSDDFREKSSLERFKRKRNRTIF